MWLFDDSDSANEDDWNSNCPLDAQILFLTLISLWD